MAAAQPKSTPATRLLTPTHGVALEHAVETVRLALRASADRGIAHARIALSPRELGGVEVHLRQTAEGLVARVVAEHATAAQLLQHAGAELRRSLEAQGLTLLRLDVGASSADGGTAGAQRDLIGGGTQDKTGTGSAGREAVGRRPDAAAAAGDAAVHPTAGAAATVLQLPNGALVDVLA